MDVDAALNSMLEALNKTFQNLIEFLPHVLMFLVFLLVGFIVSKITAVVVFKLSTRLIRKLKKTPETPHEVEELYSTTPIVLGKFVFWFLFFFFIITGIEALGLTALTKIISWITFYLPHLLAGLLVLFIGIWGGNVAGGLIESKGERWRIGHPDYLAIAVKWFIIVVSASIALSQTGIHSELIIVLFGVSLLCILGALSISFALSVQDTLKKYIATQALKQEFSIGDSVQINDIEGQITDFENTAIILKTQEKKVRIPIQILQESIAIVDYKSKP